MYMENEILEIPSVVEAITEDGPGGIKVLNKIEYCKVEAIFAGSLLGGGAFAN